MNRDFSLSVYKWGKHPEHLHTCQGSKCHPPHPPPLPPPISTNTERIYAITGPCLDKYATVSRFKAQGLTNAESALGESVSDDPSGIFSLLMNASLAKSTWAKYSTALNVFCCFEAYTRKVSPWPLPITVCRSFVIWCFDKRKLAPSSIKSYLSGLKFITNLRGFPSEYIVEDFIIKQLLKGLEKFR